MCNFFSKLDSCVKWLAPSLTLIVGRLCGNTAYVSWNDRLLRHQQTDANGDSSICGSFLLYEFKVKVVWASAKQQQQQKRLISGNYWQTFCSSCSSWANQPLFKCSYLSRAVFFFRHPHHICASSSDGGKTGIAGHFYSKPLLSSFCLFKCH